MFTQLYAQNVTVVKWDKWKLILVIGGHHIGAIGINWNYSLI